MSQTPQELGRWGESQAAQYLIQQGYKIIAQNERTPYGEVDLIAQMVSDPETDPGHTGGIILFVEVKTRTSRKFGFPEEAVTAHKQMNLIAASEHFLQEHPEITFDWRIDVISIERYPNQEPIIHHFENALS